MRGTDEGNKLLLNNMRFQVQWRWAEEVVLLQVVQGRQSGAMIWDTYESWWEQVIRYYVVSNPFIFEDH